MKFLLNVGAEKAGTTWLYSYFQSHPEFYNNGKELNIIQRDDLVPTHTPYPQFKANLNTYFAAISSLNRVTGDFTHYEGSTENIFRLFKDGLIKYDIDVVPVYIMRDPIERAWSAWNMLGGGYDFDMAAPAYTITVNYLGCKYKETIQALDSVFPKPLYFFYEDFFKQENMDTICDELEIGRSIARTDVVHNMGMYNRKIPKEFINKFCKYYKYRAAVEFISERFDNVPWDLSRY